MKLLVLKKKMTAKKPVITAETMLKVMEGRTMRPNPMMKMRRSMSMMKMMRQMKMLMTWTKT